ncbi:MAG: hypothetical protein UU72_C0008G0049 [candidate division WWE3 bacterium GW2011_GWB1_41_6]|uniref:Uncharacterized protein n=1 Tax=candidate division WWE3 bacterium GW2011_GWB1_41_6 TaxID=1619112 RepID=A0A0G0WY06_UNCKA|nr:MAG: hypothetical protein UU72_C0008G0049 [candidate division WWE3 bacterium GW2011_GWB1_41_6]
MTTQDLARRILREVFDGARDVISPGNLRSVIITQQEAVDLGLNPPDESKWNPHVSQAQLSRIANG